MTISWDETFKRENFKITAYGNNKTLDRQKSVIDSIYAYLTGTIASDLNSIKGYTDTVESTLSTISGYVDSVEGTLATIAGYTDTVESTLSTISGYVDQVEGFVDQVEGYTDSVESTLAGIVSTLATISGYTDTVENTLAIIGTWVDQVEDYTDTVEGTLADIVTDLVDVIRSTDTFNAVKDPTVTDITGTETHDSTTNRTNPTNSDNQKLSYFLGPQLDAIADTVDDFLTLPDLKLKFDQPWKFISDGLNYLWNKVIKPTFEKTTDVWIAVISWLIRILAPIADQVLDTGYTWLKSIWGTTSAWLGDRWAAFRTWYQANWYLFCTLKPQNIVQAFYELLIAIGLEGATTPGGIAIGEAIVTAIGALSLPDIPIYLPNTLNFYIATDADVFPNNDCRHSGTPHGLNCGEYWFYDLAKDVAFIVLSALIVYIAGKQAVRIIKVLFGTVSSYMKKQREKRKFNKLRNDHSRILRNLRGYRGG